VIVCLRFLTVKNTSTNRMPLPYIGRMKKPPPKPKEGEDVIVHICQNRRALHDYAITDTLECGMVLVGTEVKALREKHASLDDAFARIDGDELWLHGCEIPEYSMGNRLNHEPKRTRKLLLRRSEIAKFAGKASVKGFTLVPLRLYFKNGRAKVEIAVGKGKQSHDKRETLKASEAKRDIDRAMSQSRRKR